MPYLDVEKKIAKYILLTNLFVVIQTEYIHDNRFPVSVNHEALPWPRFYPFFATGPRRYFYPYKPRSIQVSLHGGDEMDYSE